MSNETVLLQRSEWDDGEESPAVFCRDMKHSALLDEICFLDSVDTVPLVLLSHGDGDSSIA